MSRTKEFSETGVGTDEGDNIFRHNRRNVIHGYLLPDFGAWHDSQTCDADNGRPCSMCKWADETEKRHLAERKVEEERLQVVNAS